MQVSRLAQLLSAEEREVAARFLRPDDRVRYAVAHGVLRQLLGKYLDANPGDVEFVRDSFGKPRVVQAAGQSVLSFNLSHSGDCVLCGVTRDRRIGVDVEAIRADLDVRELARSQFASEESAELEALEPQELCAAFFRCWTRKEAYLKARGQGLNIPLDQFSVAFARSEAPRILWAADDTGAAARWAVFDLELAPGYAGAVVAEQPVVRIERHDWRELA